MKKRALLLIIPLLFGVASCEQPDPIEPDPTFYLDKKQTNANGFVYQVDLSAAHLGVGREYKLNLVLLLQSDETTTEYIRSEIVENSEWSHSIKVDVDLNAQVKWIRIDESQSSITVVDNSPPEGWQK